MYRTLFEIAGFAMVGWLLLILLPAWRVTRRVAESAVFPLFLSVLYLVGVATVLRESGPGFMGDFGSAEGVLGLLATESVALVAWIHILAFDQVVAILIYRDNMKHRVLPLPLQSLVLAATLMLGPIGFLAYWAVRAARLRDPLVAWGEHEPAPPPRPAPPAPRFEEVATGSGPLEQALGLWRRSPVLTAVGVAGFGFAAASAAVAAWNGGWLLGAEGRLLQAVKFDVAVGIYLLTLALILPLAPMSAAGRRRWGAWAVGLAVFAYLMENVQAWRGLDPRFSSIGGPRDQILGGVFFLSALGLLVLFVVLMSRFMRADALPDRPALRLSLHYATAGAALAFGVGILMSGAGGRGFGAGGNLMPIHAAGFHALQAVPLLALLLSAAGVAAADAVRWVHAGGAGWLVLCAGLVLQPALGRPPTALTGALALSAAGALVWVTVLGVALRARRGRAPALA